MPLNATWLQATSEVLTGLCIREYPVSCHSVDTTAGFAGIGKSSAPLLAPPVLFSLHPN